jgi:outer membrane receptor protein involved in Fe transport
VAAYSRPYTRWNYSDNPLIWKEERQVISGFIKAEGNHQYSLTSGIRWTGYFSWFDTDSQIVDLTLDDKDHLFFGELVHEKSLLGGSGLLTTGIAVREETVENLPVWDSFYPDYFTDNNTSFLPWVELYDYSFTTGSLFAQYQQTMGSVDLWAGVRGDDHEQSGEKVSYNTGVSWVPFDRGMIKMTYGNAFRTPVAKQIQENKMEMENIETLSMQVRWHPGPKGKINVTAYTSNLSDIYFQDPAIGLSEPMNQTLYGLELSIACSPWKFLDLSAGISWLNNSGSKTHFRYNDYAYFSQGQLVNHYIDIYEPYEYGARILFNAGAVFRLSSKYSASLGVRYVSGQEARYLTDETVYSYPGIWQLNTGLKVKNIFSSSLDADISIRNLLNRHYTQPGSFGPVQGESFCLEIKVEKRW